MFKFVFFYCVLLLATCSGWAQTTTAPFLKISHLGTEGRPIIDLYLTAQEPALNTEQGIDKRYIFQSVCLVTTAELTSLLRYAEGYTASHEADGKDTKYGTFEIALGGQQLARPLVYTRTKSLAFLEGALEVLQKQSAGPEKSEAVRRLEATTRRLRAPAN